MQTNFALKITKQSTIVNWNFFLHFLKILHFIISIKNPDTS